jgi:hypothetical protein
MKKQTLLVLNLILLNHLETFLLEFFLFLFVFLNVVYFVVPHSNFVQDQLDVVYHVVVEY